MAKEKKEREFRFTRNIISVESDSALNTASKFDCSTSKTFQESATTWLKEYHKTHKSAKVAKSNVLNCFAYQVKTADLEKGGKYRLTNDVYTIDFYITPRGACSENSGIYRKRQYVYFPQNDTIVLSDDTWTGFYPRMKAVLKAMGIDLSQFGTFEKNGKSYIKY